MDCCKDKKGKSDVPGKDDHKHKGHLSHILMMVLCCGFPLGLFLLLPFIGSIIPGSKGVIGSVIPFLCPLMMILMIPMMMNGNKDKSKPEAVKTDLEK